jgi:hypothetical protein
MLAWSQTRFFVTLAIAVLLVMEPVSWITAPIQGGCIVNPENYAAYYPDHNHCPTFHVFLIVLAIRVFRHLGDPNWVVADFTVVLAFSTVGLWVVTWQASVRQSSDMRDTLEHARESLTAIERAFVAVSDMVVSTISVRGRIADYRIHLNVINSGRTPARNYCALCNLVLFDKIPDDFRFADRTHDGLSKQVIGPQSRTYIQADVFIQDAIAIFEKKKRALIYGWIEYDDIFPGSSTHRTEFCMEAEIYADPRETPTVIRGTPLPIITARPYGRYNGNDQDCLYRPGEAPVAREGELPPPTPPPDNPPAATPPPIVTYTLGT